MSPNRFSDWPPEALGIEANAGVDLHYEAGRMVLVPRYLEPPAEVPWRPFDLPSLAAGDFESMARLLRTLWRRGRVCASWVLYVDLATRRWIPFLPPQLCDADGARVNLSYPRVMVPAHTLRLAGTFVSSPTADPLQLEAELPPKDGLHLFWHPGDWLFVTAFVVAGGEAYRVHLEQLLYEEPDPAHGGLYGRLLVLSGL